MQKLAPALLDKKTGLPPREELAIKVRRGEGGPQGKEITTPPAIQMH